MEVGLLVISGLAIVAIITQMFLWKVRHDARPLSGSLTVKVIPSIQVTELDSSEPSCKLISSQ